MSLVPGIVLVGASTGGPKVLMEMVKMLSPQTPPILWVNHIGGGSHVDVLVNFINQNSNLRASIPENNEVPQKGHVYLCPAAHHLTLEKVNQSVVMKLQKGQAYLNCIPSVNLLFLSAAQLTDMIKPLGVVLTGMGDDGLEGCHALRKKRVEVITQTEETCMIYGMPRAVDDAGLSTHRMSPTQITALLNNPMKSLMSIMNEKKIEDQKKVIKVEKDYESRKVMALNQSSDEARVLDLFKKLVVDITGNVTFDDRQDLFKSKLRKFLLMEKCSDFKSLYSKCLEDELLLKYVVGEMTIHESMFFRDKAPFEFLKKVVFLNEKTQGNLKIWSACCALGQEPYSIAMGFEEFKREHNSSLSINIFATDIDITCLRQAEAGNYSKFQVLRGLDQERLKAYFNYQEDTKKYIAKDSLKRRIVFSNFNLMEKNYDRFNEMDVIFCRYSLIYFDENLQQLILDKLIAVLKPRGYLILDPAMSLKVQHRQLEVMSFQKSTVFRKLSA